MIRAAACSFFIAGVCIQKLARVFYLQWLNLDSQSPGLSLCLFQFFVISPRTPMVKDSHAGDLRERSA